MVTPVKAARTVEKELLEQQPLTVAQYETYRALKELTGDKPFSPTIRELATALGKSTTTTHESLKVLQTKGWIKLTGGSRGIVIHPGFNEAARDFVETVAGAKTSVELADMDSFDRANTMTQLMDSCIRVARGLVEGRKS